MTEKVEAVAARLREFLGVSFREQEECADAYEALRMWRAAADARGILVFRMSAPSSTRPTASRSAAVASPRLSSTRRRCRWLGCSRCCTKAQPTSPCTEVAIRDLHDDGPTNSIEVYRNAVAGAVAVTVAHLKAQPEVDERDGDADWDDITIARLARRFWRES